MKALIVGMGFGKVLYGNIYKQLGWDITYVDLYNNEADYNVITDIPTPSFDIAHICTPNFTHFELANIAAKVSKIVFVEKPGVANSNQWQQLLNNNPTTRIMMTKNNQYRDNIKDMIEAATTGNVYINWINKNRIPNAGSWFTNKELAFGGVSRDLMPHLLSIYQMLNPNWKYSNRTEAESKQRWTLDKIIDTDYGNVNKNGVYNVDDFCYISFDRFKLSANWRSNSMDNIGIDTTNKKFDLGLCPEEAYETMIKTAQANLLEDEFWNNQKDMDLWIHQQLEVL